jgi:hypothetical protein
MHDMISCLEKTNLILQSPSGLLAAGQCKKTSWLKETFFHKRPDGMGMFEFDYDREWP